MIAVIDYGAGNIKSVANVLERFGTSFVLCDKPEMLKGCNGVILPGVGAFGAAMDSLKKSKLDCAIKSAAESVPILGICLGFQMFYNGSEESGGVDGLGLIDGTVKKLKCGEMKLPHIGWTSLESNNGTLLKGLRKNEFFYFVHSYGVHTCDKCVQTVKACYGESFDAYAQKDNRIFGCQFHPEKSGSEGLKLVNSFLKLCEDGGKSKEDVRV